jgi:putative transposase
MSRPRRIHGFDYIGPHRYSVTFCTTQRSHILVDGVVASLVLAHFRRTAAARSFSILTYCLMPDHVHLLVEGTTPAADLRRFMKCLKQASGQAYSHRTGSRLWQEGYYDRVLRAGDDPRSAARYIVANPVRAGLAATPLEYPYVGSDVWTLKELLESVCDDASSSSGS